jgi:hypothetical protein
MNARKITASFAAIAFLSGTTSALSFAGCGGGNSNPVPDASFNDSPGQDSPKSDSPVTQPEGGTPEGGIKDSAPEATVPDVSLDTGSCVSDSSACNSCYDDAQVAADPYNGCSAYTKNCVQFTTPVPAHPSL